MKTFIQTYNNIGFAIIYTNEGPDHSVTPEEITAIDITGQENPESLIGKRYEPANQTWVDAQLYKFALVNDSGDIIEINKTVYTHEIDVNAILMPEGVDFKYKYINGEWLAPSFELPVEPAPLMAPTIYPEDVINEENQN